MNTPPQTQSPPKIIKNEDLQKQNNHPGYYLGKTINAVKSSPSPAPPSPAANLEGYINESSIPSMLQDPESVDDLLDVPSFQRPKITRRNERWK
jgi:hypothetical protein